MMITRIVLALSPSAGEMRSVLEKKEYLDISPPLAPSQDPSKESELLSFLEGIRVSLLCIIICQKTLPERGEFRGNDAEVFVLAPKGIEMLSMLFETQVLLFPLSSLIHANPFSTLILSSPILPDFLCLETFKWAAPVKDLFFN